MAKDKDDNVRPIPERFTAKCDVTGCKWTQKVANKRDVKLAIAMHKYLTH